ncbi:MAG: cell division transport system permease protein [Actinomycetota bacterium]|nr:cell division transport system permease protein [Actinomycetota bacterium]
MRLQFIFSEIWVALRRNLSMLVSVALVTMVSVLFLGLGVLAQRQVETMKDYWYDRVQVSIFLCTAKSDLSNCSTGAVTASQRREIRGQLDAMKPLVKNVFPESQQQAYNRLKSQYKDSATYREITPAQLPESFRVQLSDPTKYDVITSSFIGAPGVGDVQDQRRILDPLFNVLRGLSFGALGLASLMVLCSVLLVATTIRQTAFSRRRETGIMRLVGASAFNIQLPFILETLIATVVGSALAIAALWALVRYGIGYLGKQLPINFITPVDVWSMTPGLVGTAAGLAVLTSWFTLRRYLKV